MRIFETRRFKKDLKNYKNNRSVLLELKKVINVFIEDKALPAKYKDHELKGQYKGIRELHLKPDDLLMYVKAEHESVTLLAIGSHSKLFK
ncbi:MAG: type II toxin-antitoxin system YafQ family toxin [Gammaproteobacteria bacterium]|nr:type II toxin-antitoxin system YafQ family toxin [Gammaproteobacteria bacterium]